ncbi:MAG: hypothetical protein KIT42_12135 [Rhodocyclaceae bacterium]|nr:hypothetical protein [Rhodocyclaceae bacterium]
MHGSKKKILIEGDSWFSIPDVANIPIQLDSELDLSILCLANPGDTLEELTEGSQFIKLASLIKDNRFGQKWDALILSAGGNDVIGPKMRRLLKKPARPDSTNPAEYINQKVLDKVFRKMKERLNTLRKLRDKSKINKNTPILIHTYCYLTPRNMAHKIFVWNVAGPWVLPQLESMHIFDCGLQRSIVAALLDRFFDLLHGIEVEADSNFHVVDTRTALPPIECSERDTSFYHWGDEIHPSSKGFSQITKRFFIPRMADLKII